MLQLADVCAVSMFKSLEPDQYGFIYPCFMNNLKAHLYSYNGSVYKYGVKFYKDDMKPDLQFSIDHSPCSFLDMKKPPERT